MENEEKASEILQHSPPDDVSPIAKRQHVDTTSERQNGVHVEGEAAMSGREASTETSEANVGIVAYVNESLRPIKGGTIKQR